MLKVWYKQWGKSRRGQRGIVKKPVFGTSLDKSVNEKPQQLQYFLRLRGIPK